MRPLQIAGPAVVERLRVRAEHPGALVILADGRYALTGGLLVTGSPRRRDADYGRRGAVLKSVDDEDRRLAHRRDRQPGF